jgi:hypothetical protein
LAPRAALPTDLAAEIEREEDRLAGLVPAAEAAEQRFRAALAAERLGEPAAGVAPARKARDAAQEALRDAQQYVEDLKGALAVQQAQERAQTVAAAWQEVQHLLAEMETEADGMAEGLAKFAAHLHRTSELRALILGAIPVESRSVETALSRMELIGAIGCEFVRLELPNVPTSAWVLGAHSAPRLADRLRGHGAAVRALRGRIEVKAA